MAEGRRALLGLALGLFADVARGAPARAGSEGGSTRDPLHLLVSRTGFGIAEPAWQRARALGAHDYLEEQLAPESIPDTVVDQQLAAVAPSLTWGVRRLVEYTAEAEHQARALKELRAATLIRQAYSQRQLLEVMVEFWGDRFSVRHDDGPVRLYKTAHDRMLRANALGRHATLLAANARSPAVLYALDTYANVAEGPNEHFARELLEHQTVGVGAHGEADVHEVARAFTGWGIGIIDPRTREIGFVFRPERHDTGAKRVLGTVLPPGRGVEDGEDVLALLARHPATARTLSTRLVERFVSDRPEPGLVAALAERYRETDGDIRAMLRTLLESDAFRASAQHKLRRPSEYVVAAARLLHRPERGLPVDRLVEALDAMGQLPHLCNDPAGYPDDAESWSDEASMQARFRYAGDLVARGTVGAGEEDLKTLVGPARTPRALVQRLAERVLHRPLAAGDLATLVAGVADGAGADEPLGEPGRMDRARTLLVALMCSPQFQYR